MTADKKKIRKISILFLLLVTAGGICLAAGNRIEGRINVHLDKIKKVSPIVYGWHYEEIGMIGEGGLYAEMVRNRGLEEANPPRGLAAKDGFYVGVPGRKEAYKIDPLVGWECLGQDAQITLKRTDAHPLNSNNPHSLQIDIKPVDKDLKTGICNRGFFGMNLKKGLEYKLSFYARSENFKGPLAVCLADWDGTPLSAAFTVSDIESDWKKYTTRLTANSNDPRGILLFNPGSAGTLWLDVVSLFPGDTWDHGKSAFRADIMQNLYDYAPDFIRFPGGCLVHGVNEQTMYHWKETIGDIARRPGAWGKWNPHYRTDGLGYHEFYELCEYLHADAMYVTPSGMVCTGWVFQDGESDHYLHPEVDVKDYIRDCLDAIEYAIGPIDSKWGAKRAENGHPKPFPLKYVSIGNEDFGPRYYEHYDAFYRAIRAKYPDLKIIANSIIGNTPDRTDKRKRLPQFKDLSTVEIFDEHYYKDLDWVINNYDKFDQYSRSGPDLMIGEMGMSERHPRDVLAEAVFMTMVERNADLNPICADRPLMRNWTFVRGRGNPLYYHTNDKSWKTTNYYQSKMYRDNTQDIWYESAYIPVDGDAGRNDETLFTSAGKDSKTGDLILKVINLTNRSRSVTLRFGDISMENPVTITILTARPDQRNTPDDPFAVTPQTENQMMIFPGPYEFAPRSFTLFRIHADQKP